MSANKEEAFRRETMRTAIDQTVEHFRTKKADGPPTHHPRSDDMEIEEMRGALKAELLVGAQWRRAKAAHFKNDDRLISAAEALERIAGTIDDVPDSVMRQYSDAWDPETSDVTSETQRVLMRDIGFRSATDNATKLIEHLLEHVAAARSDYELG